VVSPPARSDGAVTVWAARLASVRSEWLPILSTDERARLQRFRQPADRDRALLAGCLLRAVAGRHLSIPPGSAPIERRCPDCGQPHGRARIIGAELDVSVSHSGDWVVVATSEAGPVGVDVERIDPDIDLMTTAPSVLGPAELAVFSALEPDRLPRP